MTDELKELNELMEPIDAAIDCTPECGHGESCAACRVAIAARKQLAALLAGRGLSDDLQVVAHRDQTLHGRLLADLEARAEDGMWPEELRALLAEHGLTSTGGS